MTKKELSFEACMQRLDAIVQQMESGDTSLDESLKLFEEGSKLAVTCQNLLDNAQQKVTMLTRGADGTPVEQELIHDESE